MVYCHLLCFSIFYQNNKKKILSLYPMMLSENGRDLVNVLARPKESLARPRQAKARPREAPASPWKALTRLRKAQPRP